MNRIVVIYSSRYGFTKQYAQWIANALSCPLYERKNFKKEDFSSFDTIIYGGGLYAGGVSGLRRFSKNYPLMIHKKIILFTCGLSDPCDPKNVSHIQKTLSGQIPMEMKKQTIFFHLRGGIDYNRLHFIHKSMMAMLHKKISNVSPQNLSTEDTLFLQAYGTYVDFTGKKSIHPILEYVINCGSSSKHL